MSTIGSTSQKTTTDLQTGLDIIASLPLANAQQAHAQIKEFLDGLLKAPPEIEIYLELLEHLRPSLCFVAEELARHFVNKPLPLDDVEEESFRQAIIIWIKMARSYAACAKLVRPEKSTEQQSRLALILHRCIYYMGMALVEHQRVRREQPPQLWGDLYRYYAVAEKRGVALLPVPDALDPQERDPHCTSAFLGLLLYELANPHCLSLSDQNLVRTWADNWSALVSLHRVLPQEPPPSFVIDLVKNVGLRPPVVGQQAEHLRRLDTSRLAAHLKQIRQQLGQKISPAKIGLGASCSISQCKRLLEQLAHPWSQAPAPREFPRRAASGEARLGIGFAAAYACVSGKTPSTPGHDQAAEAWHTLDQSANGFRLSREATGRKIAHGQLLAIYPHDGARFLLAQVSWLMQKRHGGLMAGVDVLAGIPEAIELHALSPTDDLSELRAHAFLLPAISLSAKSSLVIPQGWHRADRIVDRTTNPKQRLRLKRLIESGMDFEQVRFAVEPD